MTLITKICAHFRENGYDLNPEDWEIQRTYAGRHQRSAGAWSWYLQSIGADWVAGGYGSPWPATLCAKSGSTVIVSIFTGDVELWPTDQVIRDANPRVDKQKRGSYDGLIYPIPQSVKVRRKKRSKIKRWRKS